MTISTKGRYALRIMLDLANHIGETTKLKDIALRQGISEKYMEQIIAVLNKAGYVRSTRGAQGGYQLVKEPKDYTAGMILMAHRRFSCTCGMSRRKCASLPKRRSMCYSGVIPAHL